MKNIFLPLFLLFGLNAVAQVELKYPDYYKTIEDSSLEIDDTVVVDFRFNFCTRGPRIFRDTVNKKIIDFAKKNDNFIYDIHTNTDARGSDGANLELSKRRAFEIKVEMIEFGLDSNQFRKTYGHGESNPIIPEDRIRALESETDQERAHQLNRRTYFVEVGRRED